MSILQGLQRLSRTSKKSMAIVRELEQVALEHGFGVSYVFGKEDNVSGHYDQLNGEIEVLIGARAPIKGILFVLAHEVRHIIQHHNGLYKDYYRSEHGDCLNEFHAKDTLPKGYIPPNPAVGIRAEYDCHNWAINFLRERGVSYERPKYHIRDVMGYPAWIRYMSIRRERSKRAPSNKGAA